LVTHLPVSSGQRQENSDVNPSTTYPVTHCSDGASDFDILRGAAHDMLWLQRNRTHVSSVPHRRAKESEKTTTTTSWVNLEAKGLVQSRASTEEMEVGTAEPADFEPQPAEDHSNAPQRGDHPRQGRSATKRQRPWRSLCSMGKEPVT